MNDNIEEFESDGTWKFLNHPEQLYDFPVRKGIATSNFEVLENNLAPLLSFSHFFRQSFN